MVLSHSPSMGQIHEEKVDAYNTYDSKLHEDEVDDTYKLTMTEDQVFLVAGT